LTAEETRKAVIEIIADIAPDEDLESLKDDVALRDQIDLDSMDFLDIVMELRKRHNIEVPESDYMELNTMGGCVAYLQPKMK
jgi:acyl carrier protein